MISISRVRKVIDETPRDDAPEHEWAEYNLPRAFLSRNDDEDRLAFVSIAIEADDELPEASS